MALMVSCPHRLHRLADSATLLLLVSGTDRCSGQGCAATFLLRFLERPQITSPTGGANHWKGADDHGRMTEEPRAWQARTQSADAEVYGAISPSTVTNSGLLRESVDKHSISTRRRPASCPRSPPHLSPRAPWRSGSLMIECGYTRSVSRDVLAHAGVPHHAVHACHARRVAWLLRRRSQLWRWEPSFPKAIARGRAALLSRASCTACLAAPPLATSAHAHACGLEDRLGPQAERRSARTRCPCDIDG
jgi:hypothetical protein